MDGLHTILASAEREQCLQRKLKAAPDSDAAVAPKSQDRLQNQSRQLPAQHDAWTHMFKAQSLQRPAWRRAKPPFGLSKVSNCGALG